MSRTHNRYDAVSIALHWIIGIGIIVVGVSELLRGVLFARGSAPREFLKALHEPAGCILLVLIAARIAWRLMHQPPELPGDMRPWEKLAARLVHVALYALMVAVPVLGLATTFARGRPIDFGWFQIAAPAALAASRATARLIKEAHELVGEATLGLAFLHALSAIWHHRVRKDDVLTRILPERSRTSA